MRGCLVLAELLGEKVASVLFPDAEHWRLALALWPDLRLVETEDFGVVPLFEYG